MIKMFSSLTTELDDPEIAVREILEQVKPERNLKKNSFGILSCHYEYVHAGVAKKICQALSFHIIGTVTTGQGLESSSGSFLLTLTVLTSDDVEFETRLSDPLGDDSKTPVSQVYGSASENHDQKPEMIIAVAGFLAGNIGDDYVDTLTEYSGGVPCFGTIAVDDTLDFSNSFIIFDGEAYKDRLSLTLIYGNIVPKFYIGTISKNKIMDNAALITKSKDNTIMEINQKPVIQFFESLGLGKATEKMYSMVSMPFILDYNDGTPPVSKVFVSMDENGYAVCAGRVPEGSQLHIGVFDKNDILKTSNEVMNEIYKENDSPQGILIYSCISRLMSLGADQMAELDKVHELNKDKGNIPYMMAYSGGEMCPTKIGRGEAVNRFHNNAFVACVF